MSHITKGFTHKAGWAGNTHHDGQTPSQPQGAQDMGRRQIQQPGGAWEVRGKA